MAEDPAAIWAIVAPLAVFLVMGLWNLSVRFAKWISKEVAENVVKSIGDSLRQRWTKDMDDVIRPVHARLGEIESQLEAEGLFKPPRRHFDEDDTYPA